MFAMTGKIEIEERQEPPDSNAKPSTIKRVIAGARSAGLWVVKATFPPVMAVARTLRLDALCRWCWKLPGRICNIWRSRNPQAEGAPDMRDFREVLLCWGIDNTPQAVQQAVVGLWRRCLLSCTMAIVFLAVVLISWEGRTSQTLVVTSSIMLIIVSLTTHIWRIQVLTRRRFILFWEWILGRK